MVSTSLVRAALRSLGQHRLRSALSSLGVVFGVGALIAMLAVAEGAKLEILEQIEQLGTNNLILEPVELAGRNASSARLGLGPEDADILRRAVPDVGWVAPLIQLTATVVDADEERPPEVVATSAEYFGAKELHAASGRVLCVADVTHRSQVCVLGEVASASAS